MLTSIPKQNQIIISQNNDLQRYLESLLERKDATPRSWLYDGEYGAKYLSPDAVLKQWLKQLHVLSKRDEFQRRVYEFDISQTEKWGPQGGHAPIADLMDEIVLPSFKLGQDRKHPTAFSSKSWAEAKANVVRMYKRYGVARILPESYDSVLRSMHDDGTLESNSGYPDFTRRIKPEVQQRAKAAAESGAWKTYPAIALFRTYRGKTRLVWMFPMAANLVEASFMKPLMKRMLDTPLGENFFCPWKGFEPVRSIISANYLEGKQIAASDFSSTDAHFQLDASLEVFDVIKECFQESVRDRLLESMTYMHSIPLLVGPRNMLVGEHGVSSGSNWTNFVETVFDHILQEYVTILTKGAVTGLYGIGDDMAWVARRQFRDGFREELEEIGASVGQVIKAEKTMVESDYVKTLQRLFQRGYSREDGLLRGVYPTVRALLSSVYPEREHKSSSWSSDMFCARQYMILENCVDHPLFKEFVRFICKGNPHLKPFARKSARELDTIQREAKLIPGLNPTYNQEKRDSSLGSFESIRFAKTL